MVVFRALLKRASDFPLHFPAHAGVTAATIGGADFNSIDGGGHSPSPVAGPHFSSVGLPPGSQIEDLSGILPLYRVAGRILAQVADPLVQCAVAALRFNTM